MMRAIGIDFAPASHSRALRRPPALLWGLALLGLVLAGSAALSLHAQTQERAALQAEIDQVSARLAARRQAQAAREQARPEALISPVQAQAMNAVIAQLNTPWSAMLNAMETASMGPVALLEFNPDPKSHLVKGVAEARHSDAMIAFIERLKAQTAFNGARLSRHEYAEQDATQPIRFEFELIWSESAP